MYARSFGDSHPALLWPASVPLDSEGVASCSVAWPAHSVAWALHSVASCPVHSALRGWAFALVREHGHALSQHDQEHFSHLAHGHSHRLAHNTGPAPRSCDQQRRPGIQQPGRPMPTRKRNIWLARSQHEHDQLRNLRMSTLAFTTYTAPPNCEPQRRPGSQQQRCRPASMSCARKKHIARTPSHTYTQYISSARAWAQLAHGHSHLHNCIPIDSTVLVADHEHSPPT